MIPLHVPPITFREMMSFPREDYITKLKQLFRVNFNKENVVFIADARNSIYLALKAMELQKGDEILIPGYICDAVRAAVEPICKPVYVDIDEQTFNIDATQIERHITRNTKAILAAHLYGNPCEMDKIVDIAKANNLYIIEDIAQALGGEYHGRPLGSFGDFTVLSFRFSKDITSFRGGALLTNKKLDSQLDPIPAVRVFPWLLITVFALNQIRHAPAAIYSPLRRHLLFPFFSQNASKFSVRSESLCNYQCYLLYQQFAKMSRIIQKRRQNAAYYSEKLRDIVRVPLETDGGTHTYYRYTVQVDNRDKLYNYLLAHGIEAEKMYDHALLSNDVYSKSVAASRKNLNIPVNHELSTRDLEKVVETIRICLVASRP